MRIHQQGGGKKCAASPLPGLPDRGRGLAPELADLAAAEWLRGDRPSWSTGRGRARFRMAYDTPMRRETRRRCRELGVAIDMIEGFLPEPETDIAAFRAALEIRRLAGRAVGQCPGCATPTFQRLRENFTAFCDLAG